MPKNDFLTRPAPESEDDLEVPGQPFLGLLGILSEYYKYKEPHNKQGRALGNALRYLYRFKQREVNGSVDEDFGLEILDAVDKVVINKNPPKSVSVPPTTQGEASTTGDDTSTEKEHVRAPVAPPPITDNSDNEDTFSDFGFSSTGSSSDELGSKIDDLVAMVKSKVKKKKKKRRKHSEQGSAAEETVPVSEPIPKLKITFGKLKSGSEDVSSGEDIVKKNKDSPMKLTIKLGSVGSSPLLPPPPLLTLHKPMADHTKQSSPSSPKYEPSSVDEMKNIIKLKRSDVELDEKPPIKLTLRMAQPMRSAKGWISPRTEQLVNYIDNVTTFVNEGVELETSPNHESPVHPPGSESSNSVRGEVSSAGTGTAFPEPPKLKLAPTSPSKRSARISSLLANPVQSPKKLSPVASTSSVPTKPGTSATESPAVSTKLTPSANDSAPSAPKSFPAKAKGAPITTKIKIQSPATCRKRKRESSPKHPSIPSPNEIIEEALKLPVPPLKLPKSCLSEKPEHPLAADIDKNRTEGKSKVIEKKSSVASASSSDTPTTQGPKLKNRKTDNNLVKEYWTCGIFSNSLKQNKITDSNCDELDFRSNILPIYCGINYLRKQVPYTLAYDLFWMKESGMLAKKCPSSKSDVEKLENIITSSKHNLPKLSECDYVFDEHLDKPKCRRKGRKRVVKKQENVTKLVSKSPRSKSPGPVECLSSPCESPDLVIQSDCDSPIPLDDYESNNTGAYVENELRHSDTSPPEYKGHKTTEVCSDPLIDFSGDQRICMQDIIDPKVKSKLSDSRFINVNPSTDNIAATDIEPVYFNSQVTNIGGNLLSPVDPAKETSSSIAITRTSSSDNRHSSKFSSDTKPEEIDSDSDISFNRDSIIEHQSQQKTIKL